MVFSRVAVDIGGTFTDLVAVDPISGDVALGKSPTTPANLTDGILDTFKLANIDPKTVKDFIGHGSTIIINALTERKGAKVGFVTTKGYRDLLLTQRCNRTDMYNLSYQKPKAFVPRYLCMEVDERLNFRGEVLRPLNEEDVMSAIERFREEKVEAVAICFLHSYANPEHERQCAKIIKEKLRDVNVATSSELTREWREYERANTTVMNAYVRPIAESYLNSLDARLKKLGVRAVMHAMLSNGGTARLDGAKKAPIYMVESGPVGGIIGASALGMAMGLENIITLDVGGTTAKTSLIEEGRVRINTEYKLERTRFFAGYSIKVPVVDVVEIGAGGGSIAWVDAGGALRVGPQSAGAVPGPACYDRGGTQPTLVDANVVAGRINPEYFLGGEIKLNVEKAREALGKIAHAFRVTVRDAALGIIRIANSNMINLLSLVSIQRGYDPRDFVVMAFGGGSGLHAPILARELQIRKVVIPKNPAHFSAWGMLLTDLRRDYVQTQLMKANADAVTELSLIFESSERVAIEEYVQEGISARQVWFERAVDMRYEGQEHTVRTPVPNGRLSENHLKKTVGEFHRLHERAYTFRLDSPTEIVNIHLTAFGRVLKPKIRPLPRRTKRQSAFKGQRYIDFDEEGVRRSRIYERDPILIGEKIGGPAVVEEPACTTLVYPGQVLTKDELGNLLIETGV